MLAKVFDKLYEDTKKKLYFRRNNRQFKLLILRVFPTCHISKCLDYLDNTSGRYERKGMKEKNKKYLNFHYFHMR